MKRLLTGKAALVAATLSLVAGVALAAPHGADLSAGSPGAGGSNYPTNPGAGGGDHLASPGAGGSNYPTVSIRRV